MNRILTIILFVALGIPLLAYPFVLLANLMSLAGHRTGDEAFWKQFIVYGFLLLTTTYPISYLYGFISARKTKFEGYYYLLYPLIHLLLILLFFHLWSN